MRREECDAAEKKERDEEGAASSATLAKHRDILDSIDQEIEGAREAVEKQRKAYEGEQRGFFDRHESLQIQVIADRRISAITNIRQIRKETQAKIRGDENKWQNDAARWLSTGRRKVELKKREDADMEAAKRRRGHVGERGLTGAAEKIVDTPSRAPARSTGASTGGGCSLTTRWSLGSHGRRLQRAVAVFSVVRRRRPPRAIEARRRRPSPQAVAMAVSNALRCRRTSETSATVLGGFCVL